MSVVRLGAWLMLVSGGLWAGALLIFAVERVNLWRRMPIEQYAVDFRRSLHRVDPLLPILAVLSCAGATLFAIGSSGHAGSDHVPAWWLNLQAQPARKSWPSAPATR